MPIGFTLTWRRISPSVFRGDATYAPTVNDTPRMRPVFRLVVELSPAEVVERFQAALDRDDHPFIGSTASRHVDLLVHEEERKLWSPAMNIEAVQETGGTVIYCRVGPHPHLWGFYIALYASCAFAAFFSSMFGASQWTIGENPWGFWITLGAGVTALLIYLSGFLGRYLARAEWLAMAMFAQQVVGLPPRVPS